MADRTVTGAAFSLTGSASTPFTGAPIGTKRIIVTVYTGSMTFCLDGAQTPSAGSIGHTWLAASLPYELVLEESNVELIKAVGPATGYVEYIG